LRLKAVLAIAATFVSGAGAVAGFYETTSSLLYAFVVLEKNGTWGKAKQLTRNRLLNSVSCANTPVSGNCYSAGATTTAALVGQSRGGTAPAPVAVPGLANRTGQAEHQGRLLQPPAGHLLRGQQLLCGRRPVPGENGRGALPRRQDALGWHDATGVRGRTAGRLAISRLLRGPSR
jgi:hypothetical protein